MQYHQHYGPGPGPWPPVVQLLYIGFSNLFWIGLFGILLWTAIRSLHYQDRSSLPSSAEEPSALELLRRRYVLGEIDVSTFEEMLQQVLESEQLERHHKVQPPSLLYVVAPDRAWARPRPGVLTPPISRRYTLYQHVPAAAARPRCIGADRE
jgi:hypothetical protein